MNVSVFFFSVIFLAERGTSMKSHATHAVERGISVEVAWTLRGTCVGFARNFIFFCLNVNAKDINVSLPVLYERTFCLLLMSLSRYLL